MKYGLAASLKGTEDALRYRDEYGLRLAADARAQARADREARRFDWEEADREWQLLQRDQAASEHAEDRAYLIEQRGIQREDRAYQLRQREIQEADLRMKRDAEEAMKRLMIGDPSGVADYLSKYIDDGVQYKAEVGEDGKVVLSDSRGNSQALTIDQLGIAMMRLTDPEFRRKSIEAMLPQMEEENMVNIPTADGRMMRRTWKDLREEYDTTVLKPHGDMIEPANVESFPDYINRVYGLQLGGAHSAKGEKSIGATGAGIKLPDNVVQQILGAHSTGRAKPKAQPQKQGASAPMPEVPPPSDSPEGAGLLTPEEQELLAQYKPAPAPSPDLNKPHRNNAPPKAAELPGVIGGFFHDIKQGNVEQAVADIRAMLARGELPPSYERYRVKSMLQRGELTIKERKILSAWLKTQQ